MPMVQSLFPSLLKLVFMSGLSTKVRARHSPLMLYHEHLPFRVELLQWEAPEQFLYLVQAQALHTPLHIYTVQNLALYARNLPAPVYRGLRLLIWHIWFQTPLQELVHYIAIHTMVIPKLEASPYLLHAMSQQV